MTKLIIKLLDNEIWIYKNSKILKSKAPKIMNDNFIINDKVLANSLKEILNSKKIKNKIIQNKIYILINKLYCETNLSIIKDIMYNLGFFKYEFIYEEDLYANLSKNIISIWINNGIYLNKEKEQFITKEEINQKNFNEKTLLITSNSNLLKNIAYKSNIIIYENTYDPIFSMLK